MLLVSLLKLLEIDLISQKSLQQYSSRADSCVCVYTYCVYIHIYVCKYVCLSVWILIYSFNASNDLKKRTKKLSNLLKLMQLVNGLAKTQLPGNLVLYSTIFAVAVDCFLLSFSLSFFLTLYFSLLFLSLFTSLFSSTSLPFSSPLFLPSISPSFLPCLLKKKKKKEKLEAAYKL